MSLSSPLPNLDRAEFPNDPPAPDQCAYCHRGLTTEYFRVAGHLACPSCARQAQELTPPDSHKAYSRAVLFGIGAAIVGCIGYAMFTILTGWTIGYAAIGVGWLVGKAMKAGSRGLGGRRYQVTAALLTYAAVAIAFVPLAIHDMGKQGSAPQATVSTPQPASGAPASPVAAPTPSVGKFFLAIGMLLGIGLVSPFLELASSPGSGLLGLFIIFIGISAAWRLTTRIAVDVEGPFDQEPSRLPAQS